MFGTLIGPERLERAEADVCQRRSCEPIYDDPHAAPVLRRIGVHRFLPTAGSSPVGSSTDSAQPARGVAPNIGHRRRARLIHIG
jgi:hypothetical protein